MKPCERCAQLQRTCCQLAEILLTPGDVARIESQVGQGDFWERRVPVNPAYAEYDEEDPNWLAYTTANDGARRVLKRQANGDCIFLAADGCRLGPTVRPLVCRLYPWRYNEWTLLGESPEYCPVTTLSEDGEDMLQLLTMSDRAEADRQREALYAELRLGS